MPRSLLRCLFPHIWPSQCASLLNYTQEWPSAALPWHIVLKKKKQTRYSDIWGFLLPNALRSLSSKNYLFIQNLIIMDTEN